MHRYLQGAKGLALATLAVAAVVAFLLAVQPGTNLATVALALVLAVMLVAMQWGSGPALWAALVAMLLFNYYFIPPVHTFVIADTENWIAFGAFVVTALVVGQLSSRAKRRAMQAEQQKREIERLYHELERTWKEAGEAELLRKSEKLKTALLDAVTHDLRTPLTSIKASATTLLSEFGRDHQASALTPETRKELLEVIDEESDRLNRFIEGMMELAQIESGSLPLTRTQASPYDVISAALDRAAGVLKDHRVEVTIEDSLPALQVDAAAIAEVLYALLENTSKYAPAGTLVHVTAAAEPPAMARLVVEDEGPGVPPMLRERIFDKFARGNQTSARRGFGMGLAIARGIVEAHGGRIWMEPARNGGGSRFIFTAPASTEVAPP